LHHGTRGAALSREFKGWELDSHQIALDLNTVTASILLHYFKNQEQDTHRLTFHVELRLESDNRDYFWGFPTDWPEQLNSGS